MKIKAIIFDWGRTLFDVEVNKEFSDSEEVLMFCKEKGYKICVASLARPLINDTKEERKKQIETSPLGKYFNLIEVTEAKEKDQVLASLVEKLNLERKEILIVDDRVVKGVKYGNKNGHPTVWIQRGKFAKELPDLETGIPTFTIKSLSELKDLI